MNVWTYLGNNWQGLLRAIIGCIGLEVLIGPMTQKRSLARRYRVESANAGDAKAGSAGTGSVRNGRFQGIIGGWFCFR